MQTGLILIGIAVLWYVAIWIVAMSLVYPRDELAQALAGWIYGVVPAAFVAIIGVIFILVGLIRRLL